MKLVSWGYRQLANASLSQHPFFLLSLDSSNYLVTQKQFKQTNKPLLHMVTSNKHRTINNNPIAPSTPQTPQTPQTPLTPLTPRNNNYIYSKMQIYWKTKTITPPTPYLQSRPPHPYQQTTILSKGTSPPTHTYNRAR